MHKEGVKALAWLFLLFPFVAAAQTGVRAPWEEYDKLISSRKSLAVHGPSLMGDQIDLYTGTLGFSASDVSLPGDSSAVEVARSFSVNNRADYFVNDLPFADWDLEIPRLTGVFSSSTGWASACTHNGSGAPPAVTINGKRINSGDYWHGNKAVIPGRGSQDMMVVTNASLPKPDGGGPYTWLTQDLTYFSCLSSQKNAADEGFLAITTDGAKYWFDWQAQYMEAELVLPNGGGGTARRKAVLYATRVEDRFGNWVTYSYSNSAQQPARLNAITSSDGRRIDFNYNAKGLISSVQAGDRVWSYSYLHTDTDRPTLSEVLNPDGSKWSIWFSALSSTRLEYYKGSPEEFLRSCEYPGEPIEPWMAVGTMVHPSGAVGEFTVGLIERGRTNVPKVCNNYTTPTNDPNDDIARYPMMYHTFAIAKKRLSGPGIAPLEWFYNFDGETSFAPGTGPTCTSGDCAAVRCVSDSCAGKQVATVQLPEGKWERHTFGNSYRYNEGKLLKVERGSGPSAIQQIQSFSYILPVAGQQFTIAIGSTSQPRSAGFTSEYYRPQSSSQIDQDGVQFVSQTTAFDSLARPVTTRSQSSLGYAKDLKTNYYDNTALWVMGQVLSSVSTLDGAVISASTYHPASALPATVSSFGALQHSLEYRADGTLSAVGDGLGNTTSLSDWKRGVPQLIRYADGYTDSAQVDNAGWIKVTSDENGYSNTFEYDAMGRVIRQDYPVGDQVVWEPAIARFESVNAVEYGLPAGHWRAAMSQGNLRTLTYYDALWRPVVTERYDQRDRVNTLTQSVVRYNASGSPVFSSYPQRGIGSYLDNLPGTYATYDAIDRPVRSEADSEHGRLISEVSYLPGFKRRTVNPKGAVTLEEFQVFDSPGYDAPVLITQPEGVIVNIVRDIHGKPKEISKTGPGG